MEKECFEMSRYIDLDLYHKAERSHPFYEEMVNEICGNLKTDSKSHSRINLLEFGAGTGLLTQELIRFPHIDVYALELDTECIQILKNNIRHKNCSIIQDNIITFAKENYFDIIISSFAHDHIDYDNGCQLAKNLKNNLKNGGIYIMGGEILPYYSNSKEREEALYKYHCYIINKALRDRNFEVAQIEINALKSGIFMQGDFKRHEKLFEEEMSLGGLKLISKKKIGPLDVDGVGGIFVYIYERQS